MQKKIKTIAILAASLFKNHPTENTVFATSDSNMFFGQHHAESHASGLKDKDVKKIERSFVEAAEAAGLLDEEKDTVVEETKELIKMESLSMEDLMNESLGESKASETTADKKEEVVNTSTSASETTADKKEEVVNTSTSDDKKEGQTPANTTKSNNNAKTK